MAKPSLISPLPIDDQLPTVLGKLGGSGARSVLVEAPPGAGKTTRLPFALLGEDWCKGTVLVSEPRRIAARLAATFVASEQNEKLGGLVGYRVRFDDKTSAQTRLCYMTEGLLLQRLLSKNGFAGVSAIVLDEVHERSADLDVLLALLKRHLETAPDLRVVFMSATLDAAPLAAHFDAPSIRSEGRSYEITVTHAPKEDERPLPIQIRSEVRAALERPGDILVFLPGAYEIRLAEEALSALAGVDVLQLHGDLPVDQQAQVMRPGPRRRIILSTNVAESSVTIPGVTTVIDSGLAKTAIFDHWSGVTRLEVQPISQARCIQRAGRARRVAPGHAVWLFTKGSFLARPLQDTPEIQRGDLSGIYLSLVSAGLSPQDLPWLSRPSEESWKKSQTLLERLGALDSTGLTAIGKAMAMLPLPARLARVAVGGFQNSVNEDGCLAAALLAERDVLTRNRGPRSEYEDVTFGDSDLDERMDRLRELQSERFDRRLARDLGVDVTGAKRVAESARSLERSLDRACAGLGQTNPDHPLTRALLSGFVDRVAERRPPGRDLVLENGTQATLATSSCVVAPLLLALSADAPGGRLRKAAVRIACRLEADLLLDQLGDQVTALDEVVFHPDKERVEQISRLLYGKITLDESRSLARPSDEATRVLVDAALSKGRKTFDPNDELETLYVRLKLLFEHRKDVFDACSEDDLAPLLGFGALDEQGPNEEGLVRAALAAAAATRTSLAELKTAPLVEELHHHLPHSLAESLRQHLPAETTLRGGRRLLVHYEKGRAPWIESRLQDFFGMSEGPTLLRGKVPLQIHFLAPNHRALQVTTDLPGFWERHYPDLRKQLMRKYPRHLWPEDGKTANPPTPGKIR